MKKHHKRVAAKKKAIAQKEAQEKANVLMKDKIFAAKIKQMAEVPKKSKPKWWQFWK